MNRDELDWFVMIIIIRITIEVFRGYWCLWSTAVSGIAPPLHLSSLLLLGLVNKRTNTKSLSWSVWNSRLIYSKKGNRARRRKASRHLRHREFRQKEQAVSVTICYCLNKETGGRVTPSSTESIKMANKRTNRCKSSALPLFITLFNERADTSSSDQDTTHCLINSTM